MTVSLKTTISGRRGKAVTQNQFGENIIIIIVIFVVGVYLIITIIENSISALTAAITNKRMFLLEG